ncbi:hypothetical protein G7Y89_g1481 [Cudoniella acicularis]|uniref:F-box domain-containing protein n=1 Tax=Cudoniella acicularis TaxID=354080 RepID=A0A8H4RWY8_9HELO|nr:hypothetical protein G7Y89_g1481 [Cudoniella acicularis]
MPRRRNINGDDNGDDSYGPLGGSVKCTKGKEKASSQLVKKMANEEEAKKAVAVEDPNNIVTTVAPLTVYFASQAGGLYLLPPVELGADVIENAAAAPGESEVGIALNTPVTRKPHIPTEIFHNIFKLLDPITATSALISSKLFYDSKTCRSIYKSLLETTYTNLIFNPNEKNFLAPLNLTYIFASNLRFLYLYQVLESWFSSHLKYSSRKWKFLTKEQLEFTERAMWF